MGIQDVEVPLFQNAPDLRQTAQQVCHSAHGQTVHGETEFGRFGGHLRLGLADEFNVVAALAHGGHFFENAPFLTAEAGRGFGMKDAQWMQGERTGHQSNAAMRETSPRLE
ncbi:hypothetical protein D557_3425 [Bordetella holmesii 70147]|nr:hypothetical protein D557_3425 [Bordetella holmesii 70147]EWM49539.1 hypothetical protein D555_0161 [Bordetella holmesii 35009]